MLTLYIKEGMAERRNKTEEGKVEYRKKQHDNEERKQMKDAGRKKNRQTAKIFRSLMINRMQTQGH
jgi:hypothetical protein